MASKKDYLRAVQTIVRIDQALVAYPFHNATDDRTSARFTLAQRNDIIGIVTAQMAMAFAEDNRAFDSFRFNDAVHAARKKAFTL